MEVRRTVNRPPNGSCGRRYRGLVRITYIHQYFTTPDAGGGTRSYEFARRWVKAGHEVHVVCMAREPEANSGWSVTQVEGITIHALPVDYSNSYGVARRMAAFSRFARAATTRVWQIAPDRVYATSTPLTVAIPAILNEVVGRSSYVFEVRDMWPDVPIALGYLRNPVSRKAARTLEKLAYRRALHVVALAPGMAEDVAAKGVDPDKIHVIPQGCDLQVFDRAQDGGSPIGFPEVEGRKVVLYAGAIGPANGLQYLLDLAAATKQIDPSVVFVVIGEGKERIQLQRQAEERDLAPNWIRFLGHRDKLEVAAWMSRSSLTLALLTGPREVWKDAVQNKFFDSVAAGKPIATNNSGWQTQIAVENGIGFMLPPDSPSAGASDLVEHLQDREWLAGVPRRCELLATTAFNRDRQAAEALSLLTLSSGRQRFHRFRGWNRHIDPTPAR